MRYLLIVLLAAAVVEAGPHFGGRIGHYSGNEPRTGGTAGATIWGGQFSLPLMNLVSLEFSAGYAATKSDITLENYLFNYLETEQGVDLGESDSLLREYLKQEWGWSDTTILYSLQSYQVTFHDLDLGATLKIELPVGSSIPVKPYVGGGGGAHVIVSDADVLLEVVSHQTGGGVTIDPYDKVHPEVHGVIGASFQPPMMPLSVFAEYKYARTMGYEPGAGAISTVYAGVNIGF